MSAHPPPVPPEQQTPHQGADAPVNTPREKPAATRDINTQEQGQAGNIRENTTGKSYTEDR